MKKRFLLIFPILGFSFLLLLGYTFFNQKKNLIPPKPSESVGEASATVDDAPLLQNEDCGFPAEPYIRDTNAFRYIRPNFRGQQVIEFWSEGKDAPDTVVNLAVINPFNGLQLPIEKRRNGMDTYILKDVDKSTIVSQLWDWEAFPLIDPNQSQLDEQHTHGEDDNDDTLEEAETEISTTPYFAGGGQIFAYEDMPGHLHYTLATFNGFITDGAGRLLSSMTEFVVFDKFTKIVARFRYPIAWTDAVVSADGKYVVATYGGEYGMCGGQYVQEGIAVFDTRTGKKVIDHEMKFTSHYLFTTPHYPVFINERTTEDGVTFTDFYVFDMERGAILKKPFIIELRPMVKRMSNFSRDYMVYYLEYQKTACKAFLDRDFEIVKTLK